MNKIVIISLISISFLLEGCQSVFFQPKKTLIYSSSVCHYEPKNIVIKSRDNKDIHGWFFKTPKNNPKGTIIFFHGNSNNVSYESRKMIFVLEEGYNLLTFDYRGYGNSEGKPSVIGVLNDSIDFIDNVIDKEITEKKLGIDNINNLIIHGQSMGGATVSHVARYSKHKDKFKVLVLDSTYTSWQQIVREVSRRVVMFWQWEDIISLNFPNGLGALENIEYIDIENVLIMHSKTDKLINYYHAEKIFEKAKNKNVILLNDKSSRHANMFVNEYVKKSYLEFISNALNK